MVTYIRSAAEFAAAIQLGVTTESISLEFKAEADGRLIQKGEPEREKRRRSGAKELARDIAQFANSDGGCLLIGLVEGKRGDGARVVQAIASIGDEEGLREWVEHAIAEFVVPTTLSVDIQAIDINGSKVLAINVPASRVLVSLWDRQTHSIEYLRRTSRGKAWMNPDEMERHLMNGSRAAYLTILELLDGSQFKEANVIDGLWVDSYGKESRTKTAGHMSVTQVSTESFSLRVPIENRTFSIRVPHGLVDHAWRDDEGRINLILSVRLVTLGGASLELRALR